jgi:uncharacterized protein (TIGR03437 family)
MLAPGVHSITASWAGSSSYTSIATASASVTITPATASITVGSACAAPGGNLSASLTVPGSGAAPTGTITFTSGGSTLASSLVSFATASTFTLSPDFGPLPAIITAAYGGDRNYSPTSATVNVGLPVCAASIVDSAAGEFAPAAEGLATIYGTGLSTVTASAPSAAWPSSLGGVSVALRDSAGNSVQGLISYVSPTQLNFYIPKGLVNPGVITAQVLGPTNSNVLNTNLATVAPALFTSQNSSNQTIPAGQLVPVVNGVGGVAIPLGPISFTPGTDFILILYGTGLRNLPASTDIRVAFNGRQVEPNYVGEQGTYPGLDQINVPVPESLAGAQNVTVQVLWVNTATGVTIASSNTATIVFP